MNLRQFLAHLSSWLQTFPIGEDGHIFVGTVPSPGDTEEHFICLICGATKIDVSEEPMQDDYLYNVYIDGRPLRALLQELLKPEWDKFEIAKLLPDIYAELDGSDEEKPEFLD